MLLSSFQYPLPKELIAQDPPAKREDSRLLVIDRAKNDIRHCESFRGIVDFLRKGDVLVLNDTRVIPARVFGIDSLGREVEILFVSVGEKEGKVWLGRAKSCKKGDSLTVGEYKLILGDKQDREWGVLAQAPLSDIIAKYGKMPLPPYIERGREGKVQDETRYQTVYAAKIGAIAAPTAGLHFTPKILSELRNNGVEIVFITLHVGPGTFLPIQTDTISEHKMMGERYVISPESAGIINQALDANRRVIAVGTTSTRTLEFAGRSGRVAAGQGVVDIFIYPGFEFKVISGLVTNFHLPKSTPLLLACAFGGKDRVFRAYEEAIAQKYRFFSYGDAVLII
ncbi:MAG: S-adenosylmethionine:tRNA ribosyltransferase-isomerase [Parcubacteria group bacterium Gr01-1014_18]|nr:MAG: S-adenosylmethionine:tRNA ribosyltransferase-isomerase [Parcubacteria group bacterium Gr01-1014_18]TSC98283.1 MAG: S-adenosylmethionine:tRNA ribosyltransferase-isomerase [Parcubacteria group bacterium Greene1014_20]TSD06677.1 MAG: S-adenosylmethionine:tRNA ribosyltransferase-isomerase [Parcubacteria group bacterium Greene0714_2]